MRTTQSKDLMCFWNGVSILWEAESAVEEVIIDMLDGSLMSCRHVWVHSLIEAQVLIVKTNYIAAKVIMKHANLISQSA